MSGKIRFWVQGGVIKMADDKGELTALGAYDIAYHLQRLGWAVETTKTITELAPFLEILRQYEQILSFEDIGSGARFYHDMLLSRGEQAISPAIKRDLRTARVSWDTSARERLQDMYQVVSKSIIDPKHLMQGCVGFIRKESLSLLERIEVSDLNEACNCILIGSATAAEHIALRAAESLLRRWYENKTDNKLHRRTGGTVLNRLAREYPENKRPKEIILLGYLKQRRDEVAHPDRVSTLTEAETTLMNVCNLIQGIEPVLTGATSSSASESEGT